MNDVNKTSSTQLVYGVFVVFGLAVTLASGLVYGRLSQRWGPQPDLVSAGERLQRFPAQIGEWDLLSDEPMSDSVVRMLDCAGHVNRKYVHRGTGEVVSIALIVGPPGPTAVHTPEICYSSQAFKQDGSRAEVALEDKYARKHTFWSLAFQPRDAAAERLKSYYAWSDGDTWEASESPRYQFGGADMLYKIQLACMVGAVDKDEDACQEFLHALLDSGWKISSR